MFFFFYRNIHDKFASTKKKLKQKTYNTQFLVSKTKMHSTNISLLNIPWVGLAYGIPILHLQRSRQ